MVQGPSLEVIEAIRNATSPEEQSWTLKRLKNDIVGHDQRKELVVKQGVVEPLVNILSVGSKATGKRKIDEVKGAGPPPQQQPWTQEDEARLQAVLILGSLASGGRAFLQPLLAAEAPIHMLEALAVETAPRLVTATLQALKSLANSAHTSEDSREPAPFDIFTAPEVEPTLSDLIRQPATTSAAKQQIKLAADILTLTTTDEPTRTQANYRLVHVLASLLASHAVATKQFDYRGPADMYPYPPPLTAIPSILKAITAIVTGSNFRVHTFILSPPIRELFNNAKTDNIGAYSFGARPGSHNPVDPLLPSLYVPAYKSVSFNGGSSAFPALSSLQPASGRVPGVTFDASQHGGDAEHENAVCAWLLVLARSMQGLSRVIALKLLALVNNAIDAEALYSTPRSESVQRARERKRQLTMLAVPLAVKLVQVAGETQTKESIADANESKEVKEQACEALALLIQDSKELQAAAVEAGAIKRVCPLLKKSFDNVPVSKPMWRSRSSAGEQSNMPPSSKMGDRGLPAEIQHAMQCRASALEAIAALAKKEDIHRKAIVEAGVVTCIIDSLKPFSAELLAQHAANATQIAPKDGNTTDVVLAACHAAQSMSRSVSLLRTSLIDAGIAKPIFDLLKHRDPEVQIAATDVCCNLLLEFSPMREDLLAAGAVKTLAEHARQSEMGLRLASLWALKHLVLQSPKEIKMQCLEELGAGWLVGAIQGEQRVVAPAPSTGGVSVGSAGLSTPNAAGEQVDLLNPASMDVDDPPDDGDDLDEDEDEDGEVMYDEASSTHYQASQLRSTLNRPLGSSLGRPSAPRFSAEKYLTSVRDMEQNPGLQTKREDLAVQEQALDLIRNMLNGEDCAVMFEHLLEQIGVEKIFSLLTEKLAPISTGRPTASGPVYQPTEIVLSTIHVITHIANGSPKHKQLLIAQKQLLQNWLPHFNHADRRVRVICVWAVNSLTWTEDEADRPNAPKRAWELKACGIEGAVRGLVNDHDLDVRERVKTAVRQLDGV